MKNDTDMLSRLQGKWLMLRSLKLVRGLAKH